MNKTLYILLSLIIAGCSVIGVDNFDQNSSKANWITASVSDSTDAPNTWMSFEKTFVLDKVPSQAIARIGADSKYWLKINGQGQQSVRTALILTVKPIIKIVRVRVYYTRTGSFLFIIIHFVKIPS